MQPTLNVLKLKKLGHYLNNFIYKLYTTWPRTKGNFIFFFKLMLHSLNKYNPIKTSTYKKPFKKKDKIDLSIPAYIILDNEDCMSHHLLHYFTETSNKKSCR